MFGRQTFIVRVGDYVWVDPDEPATDGRLVAVRDPARGAETVVRLLVECDGRRTRRALSGAHSSSMQRPWRSLRRHRKFNVPAFDIEAWVTSYRAIAVGELAVACEPPTVRGPSHAVAQRTSGDSRVWATSNGSTLWQVSRP